MQVLQRYRIEAISVIMARMKFEPTTMNSPPDGLESNESHTADSADSVIFFTRSGGGHGISTGTPAPKAA
jgi:hypothetical protein